MSITNWRIITEGNSFHFGLTEKGQVNCNYENASENFKDVYAFSKASNANFIRYVIVTNIEYDFELVESCKAHSCSNEGFALQQKIAETFSVFSDVKSINCAG